MGCIRCTPSISSSPRDQPPEPIPSVSDMSDNNSESDMSDTDDSDNDTNDYGGRPLLEPQQMLTSCTNELLYNEDFDDLEDFVHYV